PNPARMLRPAKPHPERQAVSVATEPILGNAEPGPRVGVTRRGRSVGAGAAPPLLPAVAAGEGVALDALVPPDEHVPVDAAPTEAEARCRGKRVRVHGAAVGRVRIAWSHTRSGEEGGRPEGQASLSEGWSGERGEHKRPEADHEGLHRPASNTEASRQLLDVSKPIPCGQSRGLLVALEPGSLGGATTRAVPLISTQTTGLRDPPITSAFPPAVSSPSSRGRGTAAARRRGAEPRARDRRGCRGGDTS